MIRGIPHEIFTEAIHNWTIESKDLTWKGWAKFLRMDEDELSGCVKGGDRKVKLLCGPHWRTLLKANQVIQDIEANRNHP